MRISILALYLCSALTSFSMDSEMTVDAAVKVFSTANWQGYPQNKIVDALDGLDFLARNVVSRNGIQTRQKLNHLVSLFDMINLRLIILSKTHQFGEKDCGRLQARAMLRNLPQLRAAETLMKEALSRYKQMNINPVAVISGLSVYDVGGSKRLCISQQKNDEYSSFNFDETAKGLVSTSAPFIFSQGHHAHLLIDDGQVVTDFGIMVENVGGKPVASLYSGKFGDYPFTLSPKKIMLWTTAVEPVNTFPPNADALSLNTERQNPYPPELVDLSHGLTVSSPLHSEILGNFDFFCEFYGAKTTANRNLGFVSLYANEAERLGFEIEELVEAVDQEVISSQLRDDNFRALHSDPEIPSLQSIIEISPHDIELMEPDTITLASVDDVIEAAAALPESVPIARLRKMKSKRDNLIESSWQKKQQDLKKPASTSQKRSRKAQESDRSKVDASTHSAKFDITNDIDKSILRGRIKFRKINRLLKSIGRKADSLTSRETGGSHIQIVGGEGEQSKTIVKPHGRKDRTIPVRYLDVFK